MKIAENITELIGGTPLVKLRGISERSGARSAMRTGLGSPPVRRSSSTSALSA